MTSHLTAKLGEGGKELPGQPPDHIQLSTKVMLSQNRIPIEPLSLLTHSPLAQVRGKENTND
jgi:hypothetical protein